MSADDRSFASSTPTVTQPSTMASAFTRAKRWGKKVIGKPENAPPVVSIAHWIRNLSASPKRDVCFFSLF